MPKEFPITQYSKMYRTQRSLFSIGPLVIVWSLVLGHWSFFSAPVRAQNSDALPALIAVLNDSKDPQLQLDVLHGISDALKGKRDVPMPAGWQTVEEKL